MRRWTTFAAAIAALLLQPLTVLGEGQGFRKQAGQYVVYLTVMPAEIIRGPLLPETPGASPQSAPSARDTHHVMVAIFESTSGMRVRGLRVTARVAALGFSGEKRDLEPLDVGGEPAYANSFPMLGRGPFRIDVQLSAHGRASGQTTFYFVHPRFDAPPKGAGSSP